ncbi:YqzE family protein [Metabacillus arenae]|uniref:YqzE family protein n=1 Tax=Metabacillus arenae TaxID=2771434 RepID=A0A926RVT4_9BACI|nr:YqzE family protein [Metabacillus arenae]MBD1378830.1 YqzE family protein [Metabacillus arenae]
MSTNDYVKYLTQQIVKYLDTPQEEKKQRKERKKIERSPIATRWFGIIPFALQLLIKKRK